MIVKDRSNQLGQVNVAQPANEVKVVFLGDGEAGKTHTIARLLNDGGEPLDYAWDTTPGIRINSKEYNLGGRHIRVKFWDFGGQEMLHSLHRMFLTERTLYVVMVNVRDDSQDERAKYWLRMVKYLANNAPVVLVLNKMDQNPMANVYERELVGQFGNLRRIIKLSSLTYDQDRFNQELTNVLLEEILESGFPDINVPTSWLQVRDALERVDDYYIRFDEFRGICRINQVDTGQHTLLHWLSELGIVFYCSDGYVLDEYVILRPEWFLNAVYILLYNRIDSNRNGVVPIEYIHWILGSPKEIGERSRCILPDVRYTYGETEYVLGVLRRFQISFRVNEGMEFFPFLCRRDATEICAEYENDTEALEFRLEYEYLPHSVLYCLMAELNQDLDVDNSWRTGAHLLQRDTGLSAVIKTEGDFLRVFVKSLNGSYQPQLYLNKILQSLQQIHRMMNLQEPETKIVFKDGGVRELFSYDMLMGMLNAGQTQVFSMYRKRLIRIEDILMQTDYQIDIAKDKLLADIAEACVHVQTSTLHESQKEDFRNEIVKGFLWTKNYEIVQQRYAVASQPGKPKRVVAPDLVIMTKDRQPWTVIEAMNIGNGATSVRFWDQHLTKLLNQYNPHGLSMLFLICYVDCFEAHYEELYDRYKDHMRWYDPDRCKLRKDSFREISPLENNYPFLRVAQCTYDCGGRTVTVYHYFVRVGDSGIIKYEGNNASLIWKHPFEDFCLGSQLIVDENQEAIFFRDDQALDIFPAGIHTLEAPRLQLLNQVCPLPLNYGGVFHANVYYVNLVTHIGIKWGAGEIHLYEPKCSLPVELGLHGTFSIKIVNARKLLQKVVGTIGVLSRDQLMGSNGQRYFRDMVRMQVRSHVAAAIQDNGIDLLDIERHTIALANDLREKLNPSLNEYGLEITEFIIAGVQLPSSRAFQDAKAQYEQEIIRIRQEQHDAKIAQATAGRVTAELNLEPLTAQAAAEKLKIQKAVEAEAYRMQAAAEADEMRMKGYTYQQETSRMVGMEAMQNGITGGEGGGMLGGMGDLASLGVQLGAMGSVVNMTKDALNSVMNTGAQMDQTVDGTCSADTNNWNCSCGKMGINSNFCPECGAKRINGTFCSECETKQLWHPIPDMSLNTDESVLREYRVVFLGDSEAGKSLIMSRLKEPEMDPATFSSNTTPGIDIASRIYTIDSEYVRVNYWDFGGQEILHSMHRMFLAQNTLYVIVLNTRNDNQEAQAVFWLRYVQSYAPGAPVLLVMNKIDQNPGASLNIPLLSRQLNRDFDERDVLKISAIEKDPEIFRAAFTDKLMECIAVGICSTSCFSGQELLIRDTLHEKKTDCQIIKEDDFRDICDKIGMTDEELQDALMVRFHEAGILVFFGEGMQMLLNPEWITKAIYKVLEKRDELSQNGIVAHKKLRALYRRDPSKTYESDHASYILEVMRGFGLSFLYGEPIANGQQTEGKEFIPMLCQRQEPREIETIISEDNIVELQMRFEYLPSGVLHQLMVERKSELDLNLVWLSGAVFRQSPDCYAVVRRENNIMYCYVHARNQVTAVGYLRLLSDRIKELAEDLKYRATLKEVKIGFQVAPSVMEYFDYDRLMGAKICKLEYVASKIKQIPIAVQDVLDQEDRSKERDLNRLLHLTMDGCMKLQKDQTFWWRKKLSKELEAKLPQMNENARNRELQGFLERGFIVRDQTQGGESGTGSSPGELDLEICIEKGRPWSILEALNISEEKGNSKMRWIEHLQRMAVKYNKSGLRYLVLVSYLLGPAEQFGLNRDAYLALLKTTSLKDFNGLPTSCETVHMTECPERIHISRANYSGGAGEVSIFHFLVHIPEFVGKQDDEKPLPQK